MTARKPASRWDQIIKSAFKDANLDTLDTIAALMTLAYRIGKADAMAAAFTPAPAYPQGDN